MNGRRVRGPHGRGLERHLRAWSDLVVEAEAHHRTDYSDCPACDGDEALLSRDRLEAVVRRGGRRGRALVRALQPLDDRFERATWPSLVPGLGSGWWHTRSWR